LVYAVPRDHELAFMQFGILVSLSSSLGLVGAAALDVPLLAAAPFSLLTLKMYSSYAKRIVFQIYAPHPSEAMKSDSVMLVRSAGLLFPRQRLYPSRAVVAAFPGDLDVNDPYNPGGASYIPLDLKGELLKGNSPMIYLDANNDRFKMNAFRKYAKKALLGTQK